MRKLHVKRYRKEPQFTPKKPFWSEIFQRLIIVLPICAFLIILMYAVLEVMN